MSRIESRFIEAKETYLRVKSKYNRIYEKVLKANAEINRLLEEGKISEEEWAERTVDNEFKLGLDNVQSELYNAEKELLEAGKLLLKEKEPEKFKEIKNVFNCKFISIRKRVIDVLLKLEVE